MNNARNNKFCRIIYKTATGLQNAISAATGGRTGIRDSANGVEHDITCMQQCNWQVSNVASKTVLNLIWEIKRIFSDTNIVNSYHNQAESQ